MVVKGGVSVKIISDFEDFYDEVLEKSDIFGMYRRINGETLSRKQALEYIASKGIKTIECDFARNIRLWDCEEVIVYLEPCTHDISKKERVSKDVAMQYYPNCLVTPLIPKDICGENTLRYLKVGRYHWNLTFKNNTDSLTEGKLYSVEFLGTSNVRMDTPIWSVDYIKNKDGQWIAIDYNDNPSISYMTCRLKPEDIVKEFIWFCGNQEKLGV